MFYMVSKCYIQILLVTADIVQVYAVDYDFGVNATVSFSLAETPVRNGRALFTIGNDGMIRNSEPVDKEIQEYYTVVAQARDGGTPPRSSKYNKADTSVQSDLYTGQTISLICQLFLYLSMQ